MVKVIVLKTNGSYDVVSINELEDFQNCVNGSIQLVPCSNSKINFYANEEGLLLSLPFNKWSKVMIEMGCYAIEYVGNIILISQDEEGNDIDIDQNILSIIRKLAK